MESIKENISDNPTTNMEQSNEEMLQIGDTVKIKKLAKQESQLDPEDYYYLKSFENKKGNISEIKANKNGIKAYRVVFDNNKFGYFYGNDLDLIEW